MSEVAATGECVECRGVRRGVGEATFQFTPF